MSDDLLTLRLSSCLNASKRGKSRWAKQFWRKTMKKVHYKYYTEDQDYEKYYGLNNPVEVPERELNPPEPTSETDPYDDDDAYDNFIQDQLDQEYFENNPEK